MTMWIRISILNLILLISSGMLFSEVLISPQKGDISTVILLESCLQTNYKFINNPNFRANVTYREFSTSFDKYFLPEYNYANTTYFKDKDGSKHISLNALYYLVGLPLYGVLKSRWVLTPEILPNVGILLHKPRSPLFLRLRQNTAFYVINDKLRTNTESSVGFALIWPAVIDLSVDCCYPLSKLVIKNNKPYISVGCDLYILSALFALNGFNTSGVEIP